MPLKWAAAFLAYCLLSLFFFGRGRTATLERTKRAPAAGGQLRVAAVAIAIGLTCIFLFSPVIQISDSAYTMLTAESLLRNHTPDLSEYYIPQYHPGTPPFLVRAGNAYQLGVANGKVLYFFPHGSSWLSIPVVAVMDWFGISPATPDRRFNLSGEVAIQRMLAASLMALLAVTFLWTADLLLGWRWSVIVALGAALGTPVWSTASRAMWSHTWEIVLAGFVVFLLLRSRQSGAALRPALLATLLSWMYFVRPAAAIPIVCVTVYVLIYHRRDFLLFAATGAAWFCVFLAYAHFVLGSLLSPYNYTWWPNPRILPIGLLANTISPSRGLFVYVPVTLFVVYLLVRYWKTVAHKELVALATGVTVGLLLAGSCGPVWWGGCCYGARYTTDAVPWLVLSRFSAWRRCPQTTARSRIIAPL
jgi:hypothetical protein